MNSLDFFNLFNLKKDIDYVQNFIWDKGEIGFSIIKEYPNKKLKFKPVKDLGGSIDSVILIRVSLIPDQSNKDKFKVFIDISNASRFAINTPEIPFFSKNIFDEKSLKQSNNSTQPINLESKNDITFNLKSKSFFDNKGKSISGKKIIDNMFTSYISTIDYFSFKGNIFRIKLNIHNIKVYILKLIINSLIFLLEKIYNQKIDKKDEQFYWDMSNVKYKNINNSSNNINEKEIIIGSYDDLVKKINIKLVFIISFIVLIFYTLSFNHKDIFCIVKFFSEYKGDNIFSLAVITFVTTFFAYIIPILLYYLLNFLYKIHRKIIWKTFNV